MTIIVGASASEDVGEAAFAAGAVEGLAPLAYQDSATLGTVEFHPSASV